MKFLILLEFLRPVACLLNRISKNIIDVCRTRWVEGLNTFQELFVPLYHTLDDMVNQRGDGFNPSLSSDALTHLHRIAKFDFIVDR
jgi:hypothetical protein